jgi:polar amino acid transport system substrate-binding protein
MKKIILMGIFLILFCSTSYAREPLRFSMIVNTPDQVIGARILEIAYSYLDIPVEFVEMPGRRALRESSEGKIDGEVHRILKIGEDHPTLIRVPTPINYIEPTVFSKNQNFLVTGCQDLKDHKIGIVRGVRHAEVCTQGMEHVQIVGNSSLLMQILHRDRVDFVITARINGLLQLKNLSLDSIYPLSPPLRRELVYHYLHEKHKALVPRIDSVFKRMKQGGELEGLREKFLKELLQ